MKNTLLTLFLSMLTMAICSSQVQQVSVGPSYIEQAYFNIESGEYVSVNNEAWDISFSNAGGTDGGVFINESGPLGGNSLELYKTDLQDWTATISNPLIYAIDENRLYNAEKNWIEGAFNEAADPTDDFDYGWGRYNFNTHTIEGTTIYLIKKRDGSFLRFQMVNLQMGTYNFKYADLDGSNEQTASMSKGGDAPMMYFSLATNDEVTVTTDYDLIFQRYTTELDAGGGQLLQYMVTGVLLAPWSEAVVADGVDPATVNYADYKHLMSSDPKTIGHDWKSFDFAQGWVLDTDRAQFVKTKNDNIYKIVFYDFEGSSTGVTTLESTFVQFSSTSETPITDAQFTRIYPNPASDLVNIDSDEVFQSFDWINMQGQLVGQGALQENKVDVSHLSSGNYLLLLRSDKMVKQAKIQVVR